MRASDIQVHSQVDLPRPAALVEALRNSGYTKLPCSAEMAAILEAVFAEADAFFALPVEAKNRNSLGAAMEGYRGFAQEYCDAEDRPDLCESFWVHAFNASSARRSFEPAGLRLYELMTAAAARLDETVGQVVSAVQQHYLGADARRPAFATNYGSHLQLNYYIPQQQTRDLLLDAHEDGLLFTLLQSTTPGLEVRTPDGGFEPVETRPDELLIMPGDIAALMSGGDIAPLYHRVRNRPDVPKRMSLMYFANPNASHSATLEPWRTTDINRDTDIMRRVIENPLKFGLPPIPIVDDAA